ncbi:MAG: zinc-ribbon domain-containing protein, partial [Nitrospiraceae bacterium]|nr:zinc-ribbon domain-containing protein [Nitrospiraceae bacterium]
MVVGCPKCKVRLKVDETKLSPEGSRFKCPKCATVLVVKKPAAPQKKTLESGKILIGHSNQDTLKKIADLLTGQGYRVITATDGIDVMVKALKELPFLSIVEVALPKIYGFEVCKRLKMRAETKEMKFILMPSIYDKTKYRRDPVSLY